MCAGSANCVYCSDTILKLARPEAHEDRCIHCDARSCFLNFAQRAFCASETRLRATEELGEQIVLHFPTIKACNTFTAASGRVVLVVLQHVLLHVRKSLGRGSLIGSTL